MAKRRFTKGIDLIRAQQARFATMKMTREQGLRDIAEAGKKDAIDLASGGFTKKQTAGAFARGQTPPESTPQGPRRRLSRRTLKGRGITGSIPLLPINVQSGRLRRSIALRVKSRSRYDLVAGDVAYAKYILAIGGTAKMYSRGFKQEVQRRQRSRMAAFVQFYIRKQRSI